MNASAAQPSWPALAGEGGEGRVSIPGQGEGKEEGGYPVLAGRDRGVPLSWLGEGKGWVPCPGQGEGEGRGRVILSWPGEEGNDKYHSPGKGRKGRGGLGYPSPFP